MKRAIDLLADYVFLSKYSQRNADGRLEYWEETVDRIYAMHEVKLKKMGLWDDWVSKCVEDAKALEKKRVILSSQRARQFASPVESSGILKHEAKIYNCCSTYVDRLEVFSEIMYLLLCGCGVGYSLHRGYVDRLPPLEPRTGTMVSLEIEDSIEGWANAIDELIRWNYDGRDVEFDYSKIRKEGSLIDGKFIAPGPDPLRHSIQEISKILRGAAGRKLTTIEIHDIICFIASSVVSGGVRRSAMIALFDKDDELMLKAKTGSWWTENPQRAMANNSILTSPEDRLTYGEMKDKLRVIRQFGEPGIVNAPGYEYTTNPCLTGDTLVGIADDGNAVTIKELAERGTWIPVYYKRKTWGISITKGFAYCTGSKEVIKLTLSNGEYIRCTPEHKLLLSNGTYREAKEALGLTLSKFNTDEDFQVVKITDEGTELVYDMTVEAEEHNFAVVTNPENVSGTFVHNCGEIIMKPTVYGTTGFAFCNLVEINAEKIVGKTEFLEACRVASFVATVQSLYTDFKYLSPSSRRIAERDRAIGVSITGLLSATNILTPELLQEGARTVAEMNDWTANVFGIHRSRTCTTIKPSGNASSILGLFCSGIHPAHARKYLRRVRIKTYSPEYEALKDTPMVKVLRGDEAVISFPIEVDREEVTCKDDLTAVEHLKFIGTVKHYWINKGSMGTRALPNNISATVEVRDEEWNEVAAVLFTNDYLFTGVSLLPKMGDQIYDNAPFQRLSSPETIQEYEAIQEYLRTHEVDFNRIMSNREDIRSGDMTAMACSANGCELR